MFNSAERGSIQFAKSRLISSISRANGKRSTFARGRSEIVDAARNLVELLECRRLLSMSVASIYAGHAALAHRRGKLWLKGPDTIVPVAINPHPNSGAAGRATAASVVPTTGNSSPIAGGLTPAQMQGAYGVPSISFSGVAGTGAGETIAILDPGDDTGMLNSSNPMYSTSDLAIFDKYYGLADPPSFTKMGYTDTDSPTLTTTLPNSNGSNGNDIEISLDVEWAHVIAPKANILLVEGDPNFDDIFNGALAIDAAASSMHIVALSMSFGAPESEVLSGTPNAEGVDGNYFDTPGLVYLSSTGDYGAYEEGSTTIAPSFPATSSNVLAVGGTTLSVSGNNWAGETTWGNGTSSGTYGGGGGGFSGYEPQPAYQAGKVNGLTTTARALPDISLDADTGVSIYDTPDYGTGTGWSSNLWGGTSLASPMMAGLVAIADQGRQQYSESLLNSSGDSGVSASNPNHNSPALDIHKLLYGFGNSGSDFHDITSGASIGPSSYGPLNGYDLSTGLGSPLATKLDEDLVSTATSVPVWLASNSAAVWNTTTHTLFVTGAASIVADPGSDEPTIQATGSADVITLNPTNGTDIHVQGISLTNGATASETSLGAARTVTNYHVLVLGTTAATVTPLYTVDSTSSLDLTSNDMIILYGSGTSPLSTVQAQLLESYDGGKWDMPGLTSSSAKTNNGNTALGYGEASTLGYSTFDGVTLGGNALLVKYTVNGDANLDGAVNLADYNTVIANYNGTGPWTSGSFDYSGNVGSADYNTIIAEFNKSLANYLP